MTDEPGNWGWAAHVKAYKRLRTEDTDVACAARTERVDEAYKAGARRFAHHTLLHLQLCPDRQSLNRRGDSSSQRSRTDRQG